MSGDSVHQVERQAILTRLLDAVKQCQVRFGGRSELATDSDSRISCLCAAWETALQHGMRRNNKALTALKQMTERAGLTKVTDLFSDIKRIETEPVYWHYAKEHLTKHEFQRFNKLKSINTDSGRGRAWLRASLNEHALERYMHMLIENDDMLGQHYEDWAFLRDMERSSMLPNMAAGLGSILFNITIDRPELNKGYTQQNSIHVQNHIEAGTEVPEEMDGPSPVISGDVSPNSAKKRERKKKKKVANVVSFDEDETVATVITKTGSTSSTSQLPNYVNAELHETRENGEGTQEDNVFVSEAQDLSPIRTTDAIAIKVTSPPLLRDISQASTPPSIVSHASSDRLSNKSSVGSFSDLDHDNGVFMAPIDHDGVMVETEMVPFSEDSSAQSTSHGSFDTGDYPENGDIESASLALALAQQSLSTSRTDGDGGSPQDLKKTMSEGELKQAVVAMMLRKDSVEEHNKKMQGVLQHEMEISSTLRAEIEELKLQYATVHEKDQVKIQSLQKENELLKHQLKKYVSAVQMLRTEGISKEDTLDIHLEEPQPKLPPPKANIDYSHEAAEYEKKLIQVAEMHGELMEFNELLHRQLNARDHALRQMRNELISLRGPWEFTLPHDRRISQGLGDLEDSIGIQHTLINIWIPSAFLRGTSNSTHHVYQVYIRIKDEEWNVYRRYNQFLDMHQRLKKVYPIIGKFEFPPKKAIGKKDAKLVEVRRQTFQTYLRNVINLMMEKNEQLANSSCKDKLVSYLPFFNDKTEDGSKKGKKGKRGTGSAATNLPLSVPEGRGDRQDFDRVSAQYQGL